MLDVQFTSNVTILISVRCLFNIQLLTWWPVSLLYYPTVNIHYQSTSTAALRVCSFSQIYPKHPRSECLNMKLDLYLTIQLEVWVTLDCWDTTTSHLTTNDPVKGKEHAVLVPSLKTVKNQDC